MSIRHTRFEVESLAIQLYESEARSSACPSWTSIPLHERAEWRRAAVLMLNEETVSDIKPHGAWVNHWNGDGK